MAGWNGSDMRGGSTPIKPKVTAKKPSPIRGIVGGGLVCALAIVAYFVFFKDSSVPANSHKEKREGLIKEVAPSMPSTQDVSVAQEVSVANSKTNVTRTAEAKPRKQIYGARERMEEKMRAGAKPLFNHPCESFLAMYAIPGKPVPPVPVTKMLEQDFVNSVADKIEILETDTDEEVQLKEMVAGMKDEVKQWLKDGGTLKGFFAELDKRQQSEVNYRNEAQRLVIESMQNGDGEEAYALWKKYNSHLREKGIMELTIHPKLFQYRDNDPDFQQKGGNQ